MVCLLSDISNIERFLRVTRTYAWAVYKDTIALGLIIVPWHSLKSKEE